MEDAKPLEETTPKAKHNNNTSKHMNKARVDPAEPVEQVRRVEQVEPVEPVEPAELKINDQSKRPNFNIIRNTKTSNTYWRRRPG